MNPLDPANRPAMVSNQDIAALLKVFDEPVREPNRPAAPSPEPRRPLSGPGRQDPAKDRPQSAAAPAAPRRTGPGVKGLISWLVGTALVPIAILFVLLWQDMMRQHAERQATEGSAGAASLHGPGGTPQSKQVATSLEVVLTSPERIEARAGETVAFPLAIDATEALPLRSIVAVTGMPEGA